MKYRMLGSTGLEISEVSFGCGPNAGLMVRGSLEERKTVVARALDLGINYFDTASAYGDGLSETNLGKVLSTLKARPIIGSKVVLSASDLNNIYQRIIDSVEESLKRLRVDCIDLIQLHNRVTTRRESIKESVAIGPLLTIEEVLGPKGVVEAFDMLKRQGKVRFYGITTLGGQLPAIYHLIDSKRFHTINTEYNFLNPSAAVKPPDSFESPNYGQVIPRAAKQKMGVLVIRVLAGGAIIRSGDHLLKDGRAEALRLLTEKGLTLPQIAMNFALINSDVSSVIGGFSNMTHLEEALEYSENDKSGEKTWELIKNLHH